MDSRDILLELANRSTDPLFVAGLGILPNPDEVLRKAGLDQRVYSQIMTDSHVWAKIMDRRAALMAAKWQLQPASGGDRAAALCQRAIEILEGHDEYPLAGSQIHMQEAVFRGWSALEVIWENTPDGWLPAYLRDIPNRRLIHDGREWRLLTSDHPTVGIPLPPYKILLIRHGATYENPYGEAILSRCYWPYIFKHNGLKWWVTLAERYGLPWVIGRLGGEANETQRQELASKLASLALDAVAVVPQGAEIQIETMQGVSPDVHDRLVAYCNAEISKVIVGQTLTTELDGEGSRAAAQVHQDLRDEIVAGDKMLIGATMYRLFRWICEVNGLDPQTAPVWQEEQPPAAKNSLHDKVKRTFAVSESAFTPDQQAIEDMVAHCLDMAGRMDLYADILDLVQSVKSYDELLIRLPDLMQVPQDMRDLLAKAMAVAHMWGRANA